MQKRVFSFGAVAFGLLVAALVLAALNTPAHAQQPAPDEAIAAAADWLVATHQNEDGGFTAFSAGANEGPSDPGGTVDALLALAAIGRPVNDQLAFLASQPESLAALLEQSGGSAGKVVMALAVAGANPAELAGLNPVISLTQQFSPNGDANVTDPYNQALAILGLVAAGEPVPDTATAYLLSGQATDGDLAGSWDDGYGTAGNVDATAMAIMALRASGRQPDAPELQSAGDFLARAQLETGGWGYAPGMPESANSTALSLQAQSALGQDVAEAMAALRAWQQPSGAFAADFGDGPFDDFFTTLQALPALTARPYPLSAAPAEAATAPAETEVGRTPVTPTAAWILIALAVASAALVFVWARYRGI